MQNTTTNLNMPVNMLFLEHDADNVLQYRFVYNECVNLGNYIALTKCSAPNAREAAKLVNLDSDAAYNAFYKLKTNSF